MTSPQTVLVADRARSARMLLRRDLERDGRFRVVAEAGTAREAVEMSALLQPDAVVLNLDGTEHSELETLRRTCPRSVVLPPATVATTPLGPGRLDYALSS